MSARKEKAAVVGVGAAACAACCAGPIIGFLAAIGLGTAAGIALFGTVGLAIAAIGVVMLARRRRQSTPCTSRPLRADIEFRRTAPVERKLPPTLEPSAVTPVEQEQMVPERRLE